jgi:hypothetical protein
MLEVLVSHLVDIENFHDYSSPVIGTIGFYSTRLLYYTTMELSF